MTSAKALSDFNDLAHAVSKAEVAHQIQFAIDNPKPFIAIQNTAENTPQIASNDESAPVPPMPDLPPTPESEWQDRLQVLLRRYAQIEDDIKRKKTNKVYDYDQKMEMSKTLFINEIGNKQLAEQWWLAEHKTITQTQINTERDKDNEEITQSMTGRYSLIFGTKDIWDKVTRQRYSATAIELAHPTEYKYWLESDNREMVKQDNIWFDPSRDRKPRNIDEPYINTFNGIDLKPLDIELDEAKRIAKPIMELLLHLCEGNQSIATWVLNWLAIPLQRPGTKMDSALVFHGEEQGAGKSLFFDRIMGRIYGDYALTLGQGQLESQYNDWVSDKLFVLFEEIFAGSERYKHMGMVKQLITGKDVYVNKKFMSGWKQDNYVNAVFLSNNLMPLSLERKDRRHVVCYPKTKIPPHLRETIDKALADPQQQIIKAWYTVLLKTKPVDQDEHTTALMTDTKRDLIRLSQPNWEVFYEEWRDGNLGYPYGSCKSEQLYKAYQYWCKKSGERSVSMTKFMRYVGIHEHKGQYEYRTNAKLANTRKQTCICVNMPDFDPTSLPTRSDWLGKEIAKFQASLDIIKPWL